MSVRAAQNTDGARRCMHRGERARFSSREPAPDDEGEEQTEQQ